MTESDRYPSKSKSPLHRAARAAPLLDAAAERCLLLAARAGNTAAEERIVIAHMRVVLSLTPSFRRAGVSEDDLVSEGVLGLLEAVKRFDCDRDNRFSVYARWWVRARLRRYVDTARHMVRPPATRVARSVRQRYHRTVAETTQALGRATSREDIAAALEITASELEALEPIFGTYTKSLSSHDDAPSSELPSPLASPEELVADAEQRALLRRRIDEGLSALSPRERAVVLRRLRDDEDDASFADLGREMSVSRERVRQLQRGACEKLRHRLVSVDPSP